VKIELLNPLLTFTKNQIDDNWDFSDIPTWDDVVKAIEELCEP